MMGTRILSTSTATPSPERVLRRGTTLQTAPAGLRQGEMPNHIVVNPQMATCACSVKRKAAQAQKRLRAPGIPQGSPLSPLLSNILLDQLDKHLKSKGYRFIRYADDFSIYAKTKAEAWKKGCES